jgi:hypothetical protein
MEVFFKKICLEGGSKSGQFKWRKVFGKYARGGRSIRQISDVNCMLYIPYTCSNVNTDSY